MAKLDRCPTCKVPERDVVPAGRCPDAWHLPAEISPIPVRLLVTAPWDMGFRLIQSPPLQDVPEGDWYTVECATQTTHELEIRSVVTRIFALAQVTAGNQATRAEHVSTDGEDREYRLYPPLVVQVGEYVRARLLNDTEVPHAPRSATIIQDTDDHGRGSARDIPAARTRAQTGPDVTKIVTPFGSAAEADWVINDIQVSNRCGLCGRSFDARAGHTCTDAAIRPDGGTLLTQGKRLDGGSDPDRHAPRIARTLYDAPGNATLVLGCDCGAEVTSAEAYAAHVDWPADAVRALLSLYGIADDLVVHQNYMSRADVGQQLSRCLEVRRHASSGPYEIRGSAVVGPNFRIALDHVIELMHMRHEDDRRGLPTASIMGAISELVALLNGAYDQGRRGTTRENRR
jgi:hypothetical protein